MLKRTLSTILGVCMIITLSACEKHKADTSSIIPNSISQSETVNISDAAETDGSATIVTVDSSESSVVTNQGSQENKAPKPTDNKNSNVTSKPTTSKPEEASKTSETPKPDQQSKPSNPTHSHSYSPETCTTPAKCSCGVTQGSALGHKWSDATCKSPKTCSVCKTTEGGVVGHTYKEGICSMCGAPDPNAPVCTDVVIIKSTQTISDQTIDKDVYITSVGNVIFKNVTVNGNIYCYGQLTMTNCKAIGVYAYKYGSMFSCGAFDGTHGKVSGGIKCDTLYIKSDALDYAFNKWGKE